MAWLPDHIWLAQKAARQAPKSGNKFQKPARAQGGVKKTIAKNPMKQNKFQKTPIPPPNQRGVKKTIIKKANKQNKGGGNGGGVPSQGRSGWLPDHIWLAQKAARQAATSGNKVHKPARAQGIVKKTITKNARKWLGGGVRSQGRSGWLPDHIWLAQKAARQAAQSGNKFRKPAGAPGGVKKTIAKSPMKQNKGGGNAGGAPSPGGGQQAKVMQQMMQMSKSMGGQQGKMMQQMMQKVMGKAGAGGSKAGNVASGGKAGTDVKHGAGQESPKAKLHSFLGKDDVAYDHEEQDGKWVASLTINSLGKEFKGSPGQSKKEAEQNAAKRALNDGLLRKKMREAKA